MNTTAATETRQSLFLPNSSRRMGSDSRIGAELSGQGFRLYSTSTSADEERSSRL
jgi:hypothetical protein